MTKVANHGSTVVNDADREHRVAVEPRYEDDRQRYDKHSPFAMRPASVMREDRQDGYETEVRRRLKLPGVYE